MKAKQLLEEMADLESRIAVIYERFASRFHDASDLSDLWASMSREELHHADLLSRAAGDAADFAIDPSLASHIGELQAVVVRHEDEQAKLTGLQEALQATVELEEAESTHLHAQLEQIGDAARALVGNPAMQHRLRHVLEHALSEFGTAALQQRVARRFRDA
jgi:hypothetical protein